MKNERQYDTREIFNIWFDSKTDNIHTILPGKFVSYDGHEKRKAEVKIMVKLRNAQNEIIEIAPIKDVPVIFPSTMDFNFLFPINKDDGCLLVFSESSIGNFLLNDTNNAKDADDLNRFDLSDCIAIPGLWSFKNLPDKPDNDDDFWLIFQDSKINIVKDTNEIYIEDKQGNKVSLDGTTGITIEDANGNIVEMASSGITIEDTNGNLIEFTSTGIKQTNGSSKIIDLKSAGLDLLGATESFLKGNTFCTALTTLCSSISGATSGTTAQNASGIETIKSAFSVLNALISTFKSTTIKGE